MEMHIGCTIKKDFDGVFYEGIIVNYDDPYFFVEYKDGDSEELDIEEVERYKVDDEIVSKDDSPLEGKTGSLYCVSDKDHNGKKFKIGLTRSTDVEKYLTRRYETTWGRGNVVIHCIVPVYNRKLEVAEKNMKLRMNNILGEVVYGTEYEIIKNVY
jgi:hypothetical protein